jgi:hypothetical protein
MNFLIQKIREESITPFQLTEKLYEISFSASNLSFQEAYSIIETTFTNLVTKIKRNMKNSDKICLNIFHNQFSTQITIPFVLKKDFTVELVFDTFTQVTQSYKESIVNFNNSLTAKAQIQRLPEGSGRRALSLAERKPKYIKKLKKTVSPKKDSPFVPLKKVEKPKTRIKTLKKKQKLYIKVAQRKIHFIQKQISKTKNSTSMSVLPVLNNDRSCLLRSILIAKSIVDYENNYLNKRFKKINI